MRDENGQEQHSIVADGHVQKVDKCLREKRRFTDIGTF